MKKTLLIPLMIVCFALCACGDTEDTADTPFANSTRGAICEKAEHEEIADTDGICE